jgi:glycosyltransferase involved in cell wall biosynthesis
MRVALLTNILTPYRVPVYRALAQTPGWILRVMLSAPSEFDRDWSVEADDLDTEVVRNWSIRRRLASRGRAASEQIVTLHMPYGLFASLRRFAPDVVVSAQLGVRTLLAALYCALFRVPLVIWTYHSRVSATSANRFHRVLRRLLLARARAVVAMGTQAREVVEGLGTPSERIFDAPNAHDHATVVAALLARPLLERRQAVRERLGCRERVALVVGRLVPVKGIDPLLRAFERVPEEVRAGWSLLFVGSGPLRERLHESIVEREPGELLHVESVSSEQIIDYYAAADLLVFASLGDTWGLVVNEAFACGVPVLCSKFAGCADDMVRHGENGFVFDPSDPRAFTLALRTALDSADLATLGVAARATAEGFQPEAMALGIRRAVSYSAISRSTLLSGASASS